MKLRSIKITGMKDSNRSLNLVFSELNVSVIYGVNGCGKTTLLRLINAVLLREDNVLLNEGVEKVDIEYESNGKVNNVHIKKEERIIDILTESEQNDERIAKKNHIIGYNWVELKESDLFDTTSILFGVNRGITSSINISVGNLHNMINRSIYSSKFNNSDELTDFCQLLIRRMNIYQRRRRSIKDKFDFSERVLTIDNVEMNVIEELLINRFRIAKEVSVNRVQKALFDTLADACNSIKEENIELFQLKELLANNKEKLVNTLNQMETNTLSSKIISILSENDIDIIVKECNNNPLLTKLIVNMSTELEKEEELLQSIRKLKEVFDEYIGPEKCIEINEDSVLIKFLGSNNTHNIADLSSGEKHLLVLLTLFIIEGRKRDILMIDEPEISLNLRWQRRLMPLLSELAPNAQIIVASHSPSIAKADSRYLIELR